MFNMPNLFYYCPSPLYDVIYVCIDVRIYFYVYTTVIHNM